MLSHIYQVCTNTCWNRRNKNLQSWYCNPVPKSSAFWWRVYHVYLIIATHHLPLAKHVLFIISLSVPTTMRFPFTAIWSVPPNLSLNVPFKEVSFCWRIKWSQLNDARIIIQNFDLQDNQNHEAILSYTSTALDCTRSKLVLTVRVGNSCVELGPPSLWSTAPAACAIFNCNEVVSIMCSNYKKLQSRIRQWTHIQRLDLSLKLNSV